MASIFTADQQASAGRPVRGGLLANFIDNQWHEIHPASSTAIFNPATGEELARVPLCGPDEVAAAVRAAEAAFPAWRDTPVTDRVQHLFRYKQVLEEHFEELSRQVVEENGKTLEEARGEVRRGIEVVDFACGMPTLMMGETVEQIARGIDSNSVRVPLGVVAGICPFNFPAMIPLWMFPIAAAAGNTFVLKPSDKTPLTGMLLAQLASQSSFPRGVLNLVHGAHAAAEALMSHPAVKAISFVGSAPVAREVYRTSAANGKRVQALAGAKNHLVVMPDAELESTVKAILSSAFGSAGQRCLAGSVVVAVGAICEPLIGRLREEASRLQLGSGLEQDVAMGPLVHEEACARVHGYIDKGLQEGARLILDGRDLKAGARSDGYFLGPCIFDEVRPEMAIAREEIFGPVLSVIRTTDLDEALAAVNSSSFGNAASIFTRSGEAARKFRTRVEAGMVGVNIGVAAPMAFFSFTGWKGSFFGDLHATGKDAVRFYTENRVVIERW